jgi:hypothetical protein
MIANDRDDPQTPETPLYGDQAAKAASGVPLPSLRVLQAAGALRSAKTPKTHGGFRRMWTQTDVLKAAIAAALGEHFAWNIRLTAVVMAKVQPALWAMLIEAALSPSETRDPKAPENSLIVAKPLDWHIELVDRKFLFFTIPDAFTGIVPGTARGQRTLLLGIVSRDRFSGISWEIATQRGRQIAMETLGDAGAQKVTGLYKVAMASHQNFLSRATINPGMHVRAAWRRLHGLDSRFVQQAVQIGKEEPDP